MSPLSFPFSIVFVRSRSVSFDKDPVSRSSPTFYTDMDPDPGKLYRTDQDPDPDLQHCRTH